MQSSSWKQPVLGENFLFVNSQNSIFDNLKTLEIIKSKNGPFFHDEIITSHLSREISLNLF